MGTCYLLHFEKPYKHARHYTGWTSDLDARLKAHEEGTGARLMAVIHDAGISFVLARTWDGTRALERNIKNRHDAGRVCPVCRPGLVPVLALAGGDRPH